MSATTSRIAILASPLLWVVVGTGLFSIETGFLAFYGEEVPPCTVFVWKLMFVYGLAAWVQLDRRARRLDLPREFDALVFFAWPLVIPYYIFRTRGKRGLALGIGIYVLPVIPALVGLLLGP